MSNNNPKNDLLTLTNDEIRIALINAYFDDGIQTVEDKHALIFLQDIAIFNIKELKNNNL